MISVEYLRFIKDIRKERIATPVILLTARGEIPDKVTCLDSGADDYLAKPFTTEELLARIRALSRRKGEVLPDNSLKYGDIELNPSILKLSRETRDVKLILKESELLELLYYDDRQAVEYNFHFFCI